jgi:hypothetical protein
MKYKSRPDELYGLTIYAVEDALGTEHIYDGSLIQHLVFKDINVLKEYFSNEGWLFKGDNAVRTDSNSRMYAHIVSLSFNDEEI